MCVCVHLYIYITDANTEVQTRLTVSSKLPRTEIWTQGVRPQTVPLEQLVHTLGFGGRKWESPALTSASCHLVPCCSIRQPLATCAAYI